MTAQPIMTRVVEPAPDRDVASQRPTETRYGWCPYGDIALVGSDGTPNIYAQPHEINVEGENVANPYHRILPKNQLIPFPTFSYTTQQPSSTNKDANGRAILESATATMTALDAAVSVLRRYSSWGFVLLNALQGVDQDVAFRVFQVVQPLNYLLKDLPIELTMGAESRIDATEPLTFEGVEGYSVEPLRNETERALARRVAEEMLTGSDTAIGLATEILNTTEASMVQRHSGGMGKPGPDPLDRRLSAEMGRALPQLIGAPKQTDLEAKVDYLVDATKTVQLAEENRLLKEQLDLLKQGQGASAMQQVETVTCGFIKGDGEPCGIKTKGGHCGLHNKEAE